MCGETVRQILAAQRRPIRKMEIVKMVTGGLIRCGKTAHQNPHAQRRHIQIIKTVGRIIGILNRTINHIKRLESMPISIGITADIIGLKEAGTGISIIFIMLKRDGTTVTTVDLHGWIITVLDTAIRESGCMFHGCPIVVFLSESAISGFIPTGVFTTVIIRHFGCMSL